MSPKLHWERRTHTIYRRETREAVSHCALLFPSPTLLYCFLLGTSHGQGIDLTDTDTLIFLCANCPEEIPQYHEALHLCIWETDTTVGSSHSALIRAPLQV